MIKDIVTRGYGTFSYIYKVPTRGYATEAEPSSILTPTKRMYPGFEFPAIVRKHLGSLGNVRKV